MAQKSWLYWILRVVGGIFSLLVVILISWYWLSTSVWYGTTVIHAAVKYDNSRLCNLLVAELLGNDPVDPCMVTVAVENKDISQCKNGYWRGACLHSFFEHHRTSDPEICNVLSPWPSRDLGGTSIRSECFYAQNRVMHDPGLCAYIPPSDTASTYCYVEIAQFTKDPNICEIYTTEDNRDTCFSMTARLMNDVQLCEKIEHTALKNECIEEGTY